MNASYDNSAALVVLPAVRNGRLADKTLRAWLAQSDLSLAEEPRELLDLVTSELGLPYPDRVRRGDPDGWPVACLAPHSQRSAARFGARMPDLRQDARKGLDNQFIVHPTLAMPRS